FPGRWSNGMTAESHSANRGSIPRRSISAGRIERIVQIFVLQKHLNASGDVCLKSFGLLSGERGPFNLRIDGARFCAKPLILARGPSFSCPGDVFDKNSLGGARISSGQLNDGGASKGAAFRRRP